MNFIPYNLLSICFVQGAIWVLGVSGVGKRDFPFKGQIRARKEKNVVGVWGGAGWLTLSGEIREAVTKM